VDNNIWKIRVDQLKTFAHDKPHNPQARKPVNAVLKVVVDENPSHFVNGFYVCDEKPLLNWYGEKNTAGQSDAAGKVLKRYSCVKINDDGKKYPSGF